MDYEKILKEALNNKSLPFEVTSWIEEQFPQLAESEDERVGKAIIKHFRQGTYYTSFYGFSKDEIIAWLEKHIGLAFHFHQLEEYIMQLEKQCEQKSLEDIAKEVTKDKDAAVSFFKSAGIINENGELADEYKIEQGEQKHVDKVEPKFKVGQTIKKEGFNLGFSIVKIEDGFYYNDMGDYFPFTDQDNWELVDQNIAWSEEDKIMSRFIGNAITADDASTYLESKGIQVIDAHVWLNELKDRVQSQPQQEWSEEDESLRRRCIGAIDMANLSDYTKDSLLNWLKSLRPQNNATDEELAQARKDAYNDALDKIEYHSGEPTFDDGWSAAIWYLKKRNVQPQNKWKPSDEQMKSLRWVIEYGNTTQTETLRGIYEQLKKLREK